MRDRFGGSLARAAIACALIVSSGREASAGEPTARSAESHAADLVELTIAGTPDRQLEASLAELLGRSRFATRFTHVAEPSRPKLGAAPGLLAAVALDLTRTGWIELVIFDARHATVLTRVVAVDALDEIAREEIGHIVLFSIEAIRRGEVVGNPEPQTRRESVHVPPSARALGVFATTVSLRSYSNVAPVVVGVGGAVGTSFRPSRASAMRLESLVGFEQRSAITVATRAASARFEQRSLRLSFSIAVPLSRRLALDFSAGIATDLVSATTTALRASTERRRDVRDVVPVVEGAGGLTFELAPSVFVSAGVGAEVPLMTTEYALEAEAERDLVLLAPHAARIVGRSSLGVRF